MQNPRVPSYRKHKQSGQAVVTLRDGPAGRRDVLLGKWNTAASRGEYQRVIAEWQASGQRLPAPQTSTDISISELILTYWRHVESYYRDPDGQPTGEVDNIKYAMRRLKALYGSTLAAEFDSLRLETVRDLMIKEGLARKRINNDIARMKNLFQWAASKKLIPVAVHQLLTTVRGLRKGRSAAKEPAPIRPVSRVFVDKTLPFLRPQVAAMVQVQLEAGMRPGEVVIMRSMDLDTGGKVWLYRPGSDQVHGVHKTAWRGQDRVISLGPRAQAALRPWLRTNLQEYLFQPTEARYDQDADRRHNRKSPMTPSQAKRRRKKKPKRWPGDRYSPESYARAITRACQLAFPFPYPQGLSEEQLVQWRQQHAQDISQWRKEHHWHPNQLRHTRATEIRREAGVDVARAVLGHRSPAVTEIYAELDMAKAVELMERIG